MKSSGLFSRGRWMSPAEQSNRRERKITAKFEHLFKQCVRQHNPMSIWEDQIHACCFSPDDLYVAFGGREDKIYKWDASSGRLISIFAGHQCTISDLTFSTNGKYLLSGSGDRTARLWNPDNGVEI